jgi:hypothetical protein
LSDVLKLIYKDLVEGNNVSIHSPICLKITQPKGSNLNFGFKVSKFQVSEFKFQSSKFQSFKLFQSFRVSSFRVQSFKIPSFRVSSLKFKVSKFQIFRVSVILKFQRFKSFEVFLKLVGDIVNDVVMIEDTDEKGLKKVLKILQSAAINFYKQTANCKSTNF